MPDWVMDRSASQATAASAALPHNSAWLELKLAWGLHNKRPEDLDSTEREKLARVVQKQHQLEALILGSSEASTVVVSPQALAARLAEIRGRYPNQDDLDADLNQLGLDEHDLEREAARDLHLEGILERVSSWSEPVSDTDAEIYYRMHPKAFQRPEQRTIRHILIVFDTPEERAAAETTLNSARQKIKTVEDFAQQALRHSQCPTAMEGGKVGTVGRGKLFPELDAVAFALEMGELSAVTESEMGLHLLRCDEIHPAQELTFASVKARIVTHLQEERRQATQKAWLREQALARKAAQG